MIYPLVIANSRFIAAVNGKNYLLDTAAPYSFADNGDIMFGRREYRALPLLGDWRDPAGAAVLPELQRLVGSDTPIHGLIGIPILRRHRLTFDLLSNELALDSDMYLYNREIECPRFVFEAQINGHAAQLLLSIGATTTYVHERYINTPPLETRPKYHPLIGHFTAGIHTIEFSLGGYSGTCNAGVLPPNPWVRNTLDTMNVAGIAGMTMLTTASTQITIDPITGKLYF